MTTPKLRAMTLADLPAVVVLERELFPEDAWSDQMLREELRHQPEHRYYVVAEEDEPGRLAGYAGLATSIGEADVQTIGVRTALRNRGIGAALLTELLAEAGRRGCTTVFLEVRADNEGAQRLYDRFGFTRVGLRRRYYQPSGTDAIVMCRTEPPAAGQAGHPIGFGRGNEQ